MKTIILSITLLSLATPTYPMVTKQKKTEELEVLYRACALSINRQHDKAEKLFLELTQSNFKNIKTRAQTYLNLINAGKKEKHKK